jgi:hypothetical protein
MGDCGDRAAALGLSGEGGHSWQCLSLQHLWPFSGFTFCFLERPGLPSSGSSPPHPWSRLVDKQCPCVCQGDTQAGKRQCAVTQCGDAVMANSWRRVSRGTVLCPHLLSQGGFSVPRAVGSWSRGKSRPGVMYVRVESSAGSLCPQVHSTPSGRPQRPQSSEHSAASREYSWGRGLGTQRGVGVG